MFLHSTCPTFNFACSQKILCLLLTAVPFLLIPYSRNVINTQKNKGTKYKATKIISSEEWSAEETSGQKDDILFTFHVGPGKTGTTTIQHKLDEFRIKNLLREDNYEYIGYNTGVLNRDSLLSMDATSERYEFSREFKKIVREQRRAGRNILGSSEFFFSTLGFGKEFKNMFPNLHIVMTYRRNYEREVSFWNQRFKLKRDKNRRIVAMSHRNWPGIDGDYGIPLFREYYAEQVYQQQAKDRGIQKGYSLWRNYANRFTFINLHKEEDLTTNFVCTAVLGANHTCAHMRMENKNKNDVKEGRNFSLNLDFDMLAVHAYEIGIVPKSYRRDKVAKIIQKYTDSNGLSLPKTCLSGEKLDYLYRTSLEQERWILPVLELGPFLSARQVDEATRRLSPAQQSEFDAHWNAWIEEGKHCNVDVNETLKRKEWVTFFDKKLKKKYEKHT